MRVSVLAPNVGRSAGGPETYEIELVRHMAAQDPGSEFEVYCVTPSAPGLIGVKSGNVRYTVLRPKSRAISFLTSLPLSLARRRSDVLHATFVPPPISPQEYLFTMVCMSMFLRPQYYPATIRWRLQALNRLALRAARTILCVSQNVKDLVMERFRLDPDRLAVTYMGVHPRFRPLPSGQVQQVLDRIGIDAPYFLYCGRWEMRKNLLGTLRAFAHLKRETGLPHKLVLTGRKTWLAQQAEEVIRSEKIEDSVIDAGKSPVGDLPALYGGATALVYASLWEGFGMPIVEAMACGCPVITANVSSMPEVAGGAAVLVDPHSIRDIAEAMWKTATQMDLRESLCAGGFVRARQFTWERTAHDTLAAYRRFARSGS